MVTLCTFIRNFAVSYSLVKPLGHNYDIVYAWCLIFLAVISGIFVMGEEGVFDFEILACMYFKQFLSLFIAKFNYVWST